MIYGLNKRKLNQETLYLENDSIEITHENKCLVIDFIHKDALSHLVKRQRIVGMKALMGTPREEAVIGVTCWKLKFHLCKVLVLPTFTYDTTIWECDLKNSHWKVF